MRWLAAIAVSGGISYATPARAVTLTPIADGRYVTGTTYICVRGQADCELPLTTADPSAPFAPFDAVAEPGQPDVYQHSWLSPNTLHATGGGSSAHGPIDPAVYSAYDDSRFSEYAIDFTLDDAALLSLSGNMSFEVQGASEDPFGYPPHAFVHVSLCRDACGASDFLFDEQIFGYGGQDSRVLTFGRAVEAGSYSLRVDAYSSAELRAYGSVAFQYAVDLGVAPVPEPSLLALLAATYCFAAAARRMPR
jgi:hypothetical protein